MSNELEALRRRLEAVEAERAIERLVHSYGHVLDFGKPEEYAELFADDGFIEIQSAFINLFGSDIAIPYEVEGLAAGGRRSEKGMVFAGRDVLQRFASKSGFVRRSLHVVSNVIVSVAGAERAEARSSMRIYGQLLDAPPEFQGFGRYLDTFVKQHGEWRILSRVCEV